MKENMTEQGLISIIVPVYNGEKYLIDCLDSILGQTYRHLEIIVVDDGSTDRSGEILQEYSQKDNRIRVVAQENQGLSSARNTGLECATGDYVVFLDSDDWIDDKTCNAAFQMIADTNADIVLWSYVREYPASSKPVYLFGQNARTWNEAEISSLYQQFIGLQGEQLREPQKTDSIVTAWGKIYRKSVIGNIRFVDTKIIGTEDALFNIQVFSGVKRAAYIPATFSHYRKTNLNSLTRKYKGQLVYQWQELYQRIKHHLDAENASLECYQALNNRIALGLIGLGLNLTEDNRLNFLQKRRELKKILQMAHYQTALNSLPLCYFPIHWKVFFICAKQRWAFPLFILLVLMNQMRGC